MTRPARTWTTKDAAAELGVPESAIWKWRHRGQVEPRDWIAGRGGHGTVPLYDLEDLRPLAEARHARAAARAASGAATRRS